MGNLADHQRTGGEGIHIGDCYVWTEIYYLDSPTDYCEYLPQNSAKVSRTSPPDNFVMLESSERSPGIGTMLLTGWLVFLLVLLIAGVLSGRAALDFLL